MEGMTSSDCSTRGDLLEACPVHLLLLLPIVTDLGVLIFCCSRGFSFRVLLFSIFVFARAERRFTRQASITMLLSGRKRLLHVLSGFVILLVVNQALGASDTLEDSNLSYKTAKPLELTPKLSLQLKLHAFLLWSSVGFLMPVGVLLIRVSSNVKSAKAVRVLFYCHVAAQIAGVVLATAGAVLSVRNFENAFNNTHQRIGLALYGLIWLQPLIGLLRPDRGVKARSAWYLAHWLLGIVVCVVGVANVYIGLHTYRERTGRSVRLWTALLTAEVSAVAFVYLLQDRWDHVVRLRQEETAAVRDEHRSETTEPSYPANDHKEVAVMP